MWRTSSKYYISYTTCLNWTIILISLDHRLKILMNHKWDLYNVQKVNKNNKRKKYKKIYNVKSSLKYNVRCRFIIYINLQPARQRVI